MDEVEERAEVWVPGEFETFYADNYTQVVALVTALTGQRWSAEDVAQEAFLRVHRDWDRVLEAASPAAWVRRVAINLSHSRFRKLRAEARLRMRVGLDRPNPTTMPEPAQDFWREVRRLPYRQAQAITLRYLDDLSMSEIAAVMEAAEGTVRALLTQGRSRLARQLKAKGLIDT